MDVSIKVDKAVEEWMKKKKRTTLTISFIATQSCCIGVEDVEVSYKKPKKNNYELIQRNGLSIYLERGLLLKEKELHLSLMGKSIFSSIHVEGLMLR